jgi:hypothetical protein
MSVIRERSIFASPTDHYFQQWRVKGRDLTCLFEKRQTDALLAASVGIRTQERLPMPDHLKGRVGANLNERIAADEQ